MKKILTFTLVAISLLFAVSCSQTKNLAGDKSFSKRWNIITVDSVSNEKVLAAKGHIDFSKLSAGTAKAGCNSMFFSYTMPSNGTINFSQMGSTAMACPDMSVEDRFGYLLPLVTNYNVTNGVLHLLIGDKVVISAQ